MMNAALTRRPWVRTSLAGDRKHLITLKNPGSPVSDGDGGYTSVLTNLDPSEVWASIESATAQKMERLAAGTVSSDATHILTFPYHDGVTTKTRVTFGARTFNVVGVINPDELGIDTIAICTEVVS
jgi:SPP1 family predicted phage head-tail adaptor